MSNSSICVSNPGEAYVTPPALPPLAPSTAVSAAPIPTNARDGSNRKCGSWYNVQSGDYCNLVTMKYSISLEDFVFLNPSINSNCTNLLLGISYCVEPVGDSKISTYQKWHFTSANKKPSQHLSGKTRLSLGGPDRLAIYKNHICPGEHNVGASVYKSSSLPWYTR